ncbi:MAG: immunoglobulin domain-containing protein [Verrucomicrobia bacterium]|nr:immunoglobulin domain-containing protein [Verrucomicrobiota bacterium]
MPTAAILVRLSRTPLPVLLLLTLLQRTPALRGLILGSPPLASTAAVQLLRAAFTAAGLGAVHSLAGATTFVQTPAANPVPGTVGTTLTVGFTYTGTPSIPQFFAVTGQLPPGLAFVPAPVNGTVRSASPVITGTPTQAGNFTVRVQGFGIAGNGNPVPINFAIAASGGGGTATRPVVAQQPVSQAVTVGSSVTLSAGITGTPTPSLQWRRNGIDLPGATSATLTLPSAQVSDAGDYSVVASNSAGSTTSSVATLIVIAANPAARLANLSVRTSLSAGQTLIVGVVVNDGPRDVLVRAAGPALAAFGLTSAMSDPRLDLFDGQGALVLSNDNWPASLAPTAASVGAFAFATGSADAAFVRTLASAHSIQARGSGAGVVLVEAYDTGAPTTARLVNVSARNRVGTGDDLLIAGFNVSGAGEKPLLIRAVGPKLAEFGVSGALADPVLEIFNSSGARVAENDNWSASLAPVFATVGAFALDSSSRDAALLANLPPGSYTAQVRGANNATGEALIEIYELK